MKMFENAVDAINNNPKANALFRNKSTKLFTVRENPAGETGRYGLGHDWVFVGFTHEFKSELTLVNEKEPTKTYRYEKVDCKSIDFWECAKEYQSKLGVYWKDDEGACIVQDLEQLVSQYSKNVIYRRIEVTERELELEAAYDLYCEWRSNEGSASFDEFSKCNVDNWIAIARKTGYRKSLNDVNGKG